jgi:hypothetical protein
MGEVHFQKVCDRQEYDPEARMSPSGSFSSKCRESVDFPSQLLDREKDTTHPTA